MFEQTQTFSIAAQTDLKYWQQKLAGNLPIIELPHDYPRQLSTNNYGSYCFELNSEIIAAIEQFSLEKNVSIELILLTTFQIFLYRYTKQEDLILPLVGLNGDRANPVILRVNLIENISYVGFLEHVKQTITEALEHHNYSFQSLIDRLLPESGLAHFKVWFEYQNNIEKFQHQKLFDVALKIVRQETSLLINFQYNRDLYDVSTISRMVEHWQTLTASAVTTPELSISELPLLTEAEREELLTQWNQTQVKYPTDKNIYQLFEAQVKQNKDAIAVVFEGKQLTYQELNQKANQLAHYLQTLGVKPEVKVGICIERSLEMVVGLLGILKAGGAYVPFDPHYPEDRLSYMLKDSQVKVLLTQKSLESSLPSHDCQTLCLDTDWHRVEQYSQDNLEVDIDAENLAYVIYTSGSTGKPKGVMNTHRGIHNRLCWMQEKYQLDSSDRVIQKTPFSFDVSVWEFFWTLMTGATMVVAKPEGHKDSNYLVNLIAQQQITTIHFVPSMLQVFLQESNLERCSSLKRVFCSGEALPFELTKRFFDRFECELHNLYGPTEAAIDVTFWQCQPEDDLQVVPIGRPIANTQTYILDKHLQPVPIGVLGELYLGGTNLARGYFNRPKLTAEKFILNPIDREISPRLYKTGDLARYRQDGNIEFLGRIDHQVKLRGFRIELGEIEAVLDTHPQIDQAVVLATDDLTGNKRLVAYLASNESIKTAQLKEFLAAKLPEYMIPTIFMTLESIPLTPNGKVDRRALPAPDIRQEMEKSYQAPATVEEKLIADIWKSVLNLEKVGVDDNFFELGGNSLLAMQIVSRMRQLDIELPLNSLFDSPTIAKLALVIQHRQVTTESVREIQSIERDRTLPLSAAERSLWFFDRLHPQSCVYNIPLTFKLNGVVKPSLLEESLNRVIQRHEILRTSYVEVNGQPQKLIISDLRLELPANDVATETEATQIALQQARQSFELKSAPLLRAKLLCLPDNCYWLLITCHHIVFDGWSIQVLFDELIQHYDALSNNSTTSLPELAIQYVDYAHWQQQWLHSNEYTQQLNYWRSQLADATPLIELPSDRARPSVQTYAGDRFYFELDDDLTQSLNSLSKQEGVTLYMTLLSAFKALLYRYTGQPDLVVGSPFANRNSADSEQLIGFLVNTLVLKTNLANELSFSELLSRVKDVTLEAYANASLPFENLVKELQPERDLSYNPLFQVMFALQKQLPTTQSGSGLTWEIGERPRLETPRRRKTQGNAPIADARRKGTRELGESVNYDCSMFDLTLDLVETTAGIKGHFEYNTDLFERETISRMVGHWQTLLAAIIANSQAQITHLPILTTTEQQTLIDWNQVKNHDRQQSIQQLFEDRVEHTPNAVAVVFQDEQLTYQQLNQQANQLAHYLKSLGVKGETLVGICIERSLNTIVSLLAILKAGGAYVPLDPAYPQERLAYMIKDANISILLTQTKHLASLPKNTARVINLDADWSKIVTYSTKNLVVSAVDKNLAYVIYTSGSTGNPKGVMITHQGLTSFTQTAIEEYQITQSDRILQFSSINFDAAVEEIFPCLCTGATLVLRTDEMLALPVLFDTCNKLKLTILDLPTAYWHQLVAEISKHDLSLPESVRLVIIGGEAVLPEPVRLWQEYVVKSGRNNLELINSYGPTETTVVATSYKISATPLSGEVPIGRPLAHLQTYILDKQQQLLPIGVPGELHIGGDSLARGYLNRPDLTTARFITNPFDSEANQRLYKTGDLAKYLPNGEIEYLGRIDNQVKLRGFRIELGEIESLLTQHPAINEVAVIVREESGNKTLVAYIVSSLTLQSKEVRSFLQERLPNYMMPNAFVFLKTMPLTPSGKLDRRALPAPDMSVTEAELAPPTNEVEEKLVRIWSEVMNIHPLGIHDNFFELGGHSLLAVKLIAEIERQFKRKLPLTVLIESPTIRQLAIILQTPRSHTIFDSIVKLKSGTTTPLFLVHDADGETILYKNLANHLKPEQPVYAIRPRTKADTDATMLPTRISEMVTYYIKEIRQVQPKGPYLIGGLCAGGVLAFEIACQLQAEGEEVPLVAIIDAISPQGIGNNYVSINSDRQKSFFQALKMQNNGIKSITNLIQIVFTKVANLVSYEVSTKTKKLTDDLKIKLLRYCSDRDLTVPQFCQNVPLRSIYTYAEGDYIKAKPSVYRGQLTLWRATEKLDLSNPAIDDTPAILEVTDPLLGWGKLATRGVAVHDIPGGHSSMLQEPNVRTMVDKLQPYIDRCQSKGEADN